MIKILLPVLSFDNYSFSYGQNKSTVLKNITLEINTGEIVLIAGHSGCGKSTFLKSINGLSAVILTNALILNLLIA